MLIAAIISALLYNISSGFVSGKYTLFEIALFFVFITSSIFFILLVFGENYKNIKLGILNVLQLHKSSYNVDIFFIFVWFIGVLILNSFIAGGAVRYNTLLLPTLLFSYCILLEKYSKQFKLNPTAISFAILLLTLLISIPVAYADYVYANSFREFAANVPQNYKTEDNTIHYLGGGGFQYYMDKYGYRMLLNDDNSPVKGDIIIWAKRHFEKVMAPELAKRIELIDRKSYNSKLPVRIQNPDSHAGFYTLGGGFLPFSFSNSNISEFEIYLVTE